jgi:hypothetical protein
MSHEAGATGGEKEFAGDAAIARSMPAALGCTSPGSVDRAVLMFWCSGLLHRASSCVCVGIALSGNCLCFPQAVGVGLEPPGEKCIGAGLWEAEGRAEPVARCLAPGVFSAEIGCLTQMILGQRWFSSEQECVQLHGERHCNRNRRRFHSLWCAVRLYVSFVGCQQCVSFVGCQQRPDRVLLPNCTP